MRVQRWISLAVVAAVLVLTVGASALSPAAADDQPIGSLLGSLLFLLGQPPTTPTTPTSPTPSGPTTPPTPAPTPTAAPDDTAAGSWVGIDGQAHFTSTDPVVDGIPGTNEMFSAWDFDDACRAGQAFTDGLGWMNRIAKVIKRSGRTVVWTVPANKTAVDGRSIDWSTSPQGSCARLGMRQQAATLDSYPGVNYVPLRKRLAADHRRTYWRTDPHWTSVGASDWVHALAQRLSPRLARAQKWYPTTASYWGLLNQYRDVSTMETEPALRPGRAVRVVSTKGVTPEAALPPPSVLQHTDEIKDLRWVSDPGSKTWRGRTLLIGDSFTFSSLQLMRPLFARGEFLWFYVNDPATIARAVVQSRTVVLELLQVGVAVWGRQAMPALYHAIRDALQGQRIQHAQH